jgi:hypothetical protein
VPVDVWAGIDDQLLDRRWPHELARRIPGGHFLANTHYREIFEALSAGP